MANYDFITTALNLQESQIDFLRTAEINDIVHVQIKLLNQYPTCPICGGGSRIKEYKHRTYNHLPLFGKPSVIEWKRARYECKDCYNTFSEPNPFGPENFHQSYALLNQIALSLRNLHKTFEDIAAEFHVSKATVQLYADSFLRVPRQSLPENLGIDELHSGMAKYGGSYLAVLVDNDKRVLNEVLPNRSKKTLSNYFENIPLEERKKVKYVTLDLWIPYKEVALKYFPNCIVAVDPFHVIKHLTEGFTKLRISIMNQSVINSPTYYLLKKWHKLLESDYNLDNEPKYNSYFKQKMNYRDIYNLLLGINEDLKCAYYLKELYRDFNNKATEEDCEEYLHQIQKIFLESNLPCYQEFISLLETWKPEILNSFTRTKDNKKLSNALTENINGRLRELIHISHGYTNFERFRARALYCLNERVSYSLTTSLQSQKRERKTRGPYKTKEKVFERNEDIDNELE